MPEQLDVGPGTLVEERLQLSRDPQFRLDLHLDRSLVAGQIRPSSREVLERGPSGELGAADRVADALAGERVDQAGGIADERDLSRDECAVWISERQVMPAQLRQSVAVERLAAGVLRELIAQRRRGRWKSAQSDIAVVAFGKHPAVAAGHRTELEADGVAPTFPGTLLGTVRVALQGYRAAQPGQTECSPDHSVSAVRRDNHTGLVDVPVGQPERCALDTAHRRAVAELGSGRDRLLGHEGVQPRTLGHDRERLVIAVFKLPGTLVADPKRRDRLLGHWIERVGEHPDRRDQDTAAARFVAREAGAVEQQDVGARLCQVVGGRRSARSRADDYDVPASRHLSHTVLRPAAIGAAKQKMIASIGSPKAIARKGSGAATSRMPSSAIRVIR